MVLLSEPDIARLRERAIQSQNRKAGQPWIHVRFKGGPLDGLNLRVLQSEASNNYLGFCAPTDTGPVQVLYTPSDEPGVWVFNACETVSERMSGYPSSQSTPIISPSSTTAFSRSS